jgi:hypothetical protein
MQIKRFGYQTGSVKFLNETPINRDQRSRPSGEKPNRGNIRMKWPRALPWRLKIPGHMDLKTLADVQADRLSAERDAG